MASIAAAQDNNAGSIGIAHGVRVHAMKVLTGNRTNTPLSSVIEAVEHVTAQKLANPSTPVVVNISFGLHIGTAAYNALDEAIQASIEAGVVYTIAAGNEGIDATHISPAHVTEAITVGACDRTNRFAAFSNYGPVVDLLAPAKILRYLRRNAPR